MDHKEKRTRPAFYGSVGVDRSERRFLPFAEVQPGVCHFGPWELDITLKSYTFLSCKENSPLSSPCSPGEDRGVVALILCS